MVDDFTRDAAHDDEGRPSNPSRRSEQIAACYQQLFADQRIELYQSVRHRCAGE